MVPATTKDRKTSSFQMVRWTKLSIDQHLARYQCMKRAEKHTGRDNTLLKWEKRGIWICNRRYSGAYRRRSKNFSITRHKRLSSKWTLSQRYSGYGPENIDQSVQVQQLFQYNMRMDISSKQRQILHTGGLDIFRYCLTISLATARARTNGNICANISLQVRLQN